MNCRQDNSGCSELIATEEKATICINYSSHNMSSTVQAINLSQTQLGLSLQLVPENTTKNTEKGSKTRVLTKCDQCKRLEKQKQNNSKLGRVTDRQLKEDGGWGRRGCKIMTHPGFIISFPFGISHLWNRMNYVANASLLIGLIYHWDRLVVAMKTP